MKVLIVFLLIAITGIGTFKDKDTEPVTDVIEFEALHGFNGRCQGECNVYFGNKILTVNGQPPEADVYYPLFVPCPSKIRIQEGKVYKLEVERFIPCDCTSIIDTLNNTRYYKLIRLLSK